MKVSNASKSTTLRHATAASQGDRSPTSASSFGLRNTDGGGTVVYPVRVQNFRGADVVDLGSAEVDIIVRGAGPFLANDAGAALAYGAVVVITPTGLQTTTTVRDTRPIGVVQRSTDDNLNAPTVSVGYVAQINTTGTVNAGDYLETSASAGLAQSGGTTPRSGTFAQALANGPNPPGIMQALPVPGSVAGGLNRVQLGTTSLGGSFDTTLKSVYKKITVTTAGMLSSISVGVKGASSGTANMTVFLMSDSAGTPSLLIASSSPNRDSGGTSLIGQFILNGTARFVTVAVGRWLTAADYWIGVVTNAAAGTDVQLAYTGSGSDRTKATTDGPYDESIGGGSAGSNNYSIYADLLN